MTREQEIESLRAKLAVALEKEYETDDHLAEVVGQKVGVMSAAQLIQVWDQIDLDVRVNVGMGATDPLAKMQKFTHALQTYAGAMTAVPDADPEAIRREVFGLAGYKDGSRFFKDAENPVNQRMQQQMQEMQQALQEAQSGKDAALLDAQVTIVPPLRAT